jgi:ATP-dependent Clp protease protease subunit
MLEFHFNGDMLMDEDAEVWRYFGENFNVCPADIRELCARADGDEITLYFNSDGGALVAGTEIYSILREYKGNVTAHIQSRAASSATVAMMGCDRIVAEAVSLVLIHNPSTVAYGDASAMRMTANELDSVKNAIMNAYTGRMNKSREEISALMDRNCWMDAHLAKENGLIDEILESPSSVKWVTNSVCRSIYPSKKMIDDYRAAKSETANRAAAAKAFLENYR